jgi:hypothetical protein
VLIPALYLTPASGELTTTGGRALTRPPVHLAIVQPICSSSRTSQSTPA